MAATTDDCSVGPMVSTMVDRMVAGSADPSVSIMVDGMDDWRDLSSAETMAAGWVRPTVVDWVALWGYRTAATTDDRSVYHLADARVVTTVATTAHSSVDG